MLFAKLGINVDDKAISVSVERSCVVVPEMDATVSDTLKLDRSIIEPFDVIEDPDNH